MLHCHTRPALAVTLAAPVLYLACYSATPHLCLWRGDACSTLAVHRDLRDGHACKLKYGKDWDEYCSKVKYRIIPYIY